jgi:glycosyltransferase involved in cell wall biosynthesis
MVSESNKVVSVIIPCFKQAHFLKEAIDSVMVQSYPYYEVVVVDDGSPDNVEAVTSQYPNVKLVRQANAGVAIARNNGRQNCTGDYLIFLDADDRLLPNALEAGVKFLEQNAACAFVSGLVQLMDDYGNFIETPHQPIVEADHFKVLLQSNYIWSPGAVLYRSSIFDLNNGFDPTAGRSEDYELNIRIARNHSVGCHGEVILQYRVHQCNTTNNYALMLRSGVDVRRRQYKYVKHNKELLKAWRKGIRIVQADVGGRLIAQISESISAGGFSKVMKQHFSFLLKYYPYGLVKLMWLLLRKLFVKEA